jgi:hypothetical protein
VRTINDECCAKCGYDLTGLARLGTCPECGQTYDAERGVGLERPGLAAHQRGERWVRRLTTWGLALLAVMVLGCAAVIQLFSTNLARPETLWALAGITAAVLILAAVTNALATRP